MERRKNSLETNERLDIIYLSTLRSEFHFHGLTAISFSKGVEEGPPLTCNKNKGLNSAIVFQSFRVRLAAPHEVLAHQIAQLIRYEGIEPDLSLFTVQMCNFERHYWSKRTFNTDGTIDQWQQYIFSKRE
ncbi:unnamed protein product [Hydatigera taeniaeformis]|uniref:Tautomerase family protein n=1 Tax=Hydatigena taeniaeformis TaxID=6205 RepID=A0A0R3WZL6_HYDTA|nr:unnamed protein product [Hydatigera taeniaeformis]